MQRTRIPPPEPRASAKRHWLNLRSAPLAYLSLIWLFLIVALILQREGAAY